MKIRMGLEELALLRLDQRRDVQASPNRWGTARTRNTLGHWLT